MTTLQQGPEQNDQVLCLGASPDAKLNAYKVFIGDLPSDITREELTTVFSTYGDVVHIHIMDPHPRTQLRCALLSYTREQAAEDAISVLHDQYKIRADASHPIKVSWAKDKTEGSKHNARILESEGYKLFVGGLPCDCTEHELKTVFGTYGEVGRIHMMPPHQQTNRVAAFIFYTDKEAAEDAIKLLDRQYKIREDADLPIEVRWAERKGDRIAGAARPGAAPAPPAPPTRQSADGWKLFVGGLPSDIQEEEIRTVFMTYGEVGKVHIMPPHAVFGRVAAFVFYADQQAACDAIKVLNDVYKIRTDAESPIQVRWAGQKSDAKSGGSGQDHGKGGDHGKGDCGGKGGVKTTGRWHGNCPPPPVSSLGQGHQREWTSSSSSKGETYHGKGGGRGGKGGSTEVCDQKLFVGNLPEDVTDDALSYVFGTYGKVLHIHVMKGRSKTGAACAFVELANNAEAEVAIATLNDKYEIKPGAGTILVKRANAGGARSRPY